MQQNCPDSKGEENGDDAHNLTVEKLLVSCMQHSVYFWQSSTLERQLAKFEKVIELLEAKEKRSEVEMKKVKVSHYL